MIIGYKLYNWSIFGMFCLLIFRDRVERLKCKVVKVMVMIVIVFVICWFLVYVVYYYVIF